MPLVAQENTIAKRFTKQGAEEGQMILAHLFWGSAMGVAAALGSTLTGLPLGGVVLAYVLAGAAGLLASAVVLDRQGSVG